MHCVLVLNAGYFTANSPKVGANGGSLEYKFILPHSHADPLLYQNEPSRESIFCDKVSTWWIKRALMRLNILLKTGQKCLCRIPTREQRHRNHIHLLSTARAVARHVAHGQRTQHYGNAEVKPPLTASFQLVDGALNAFCQVAFLKHNHDLPQAKGGRISDFIVPLCLPRTWAECLSWFYSTKSINPSPFIRRLKVKTSSRLRITNNATKVELLRRLFMSVAATSKFTKWAIGKFLRRRVNLVATNL